QQFIQLEFDEPFTAALLKLSGAGQVVPFQGVLQISDDGRRFREVRQFACSRAELSLNFEQVAARYFRIVFTQAEPSANGGLQLSELELTPVYRLELAQAKAGLGRCPPNSSAPPVVPNFAVIHKSELLELSSKTDGNGHLKWDVPKGQWTVLR